MRNRQASPRALVEYRRAIHRRWRAPPHQASRRNLSRLDGQRWRQRPRPACRSCLIIIRIGRSIRSGRPMWMVFPLSAMGLLIALWMLRRLIGRGPAAAMLFFAVTLVLALGFVYALPMRYWYVAEPFPRPGCLPPCWIAD